MQDILYKAALSLREITTSPQREACLLMAHVLQKTYEEVYFAKETQITEEQSRLFHQLLDRRLAFEPLSKIRQHREFWGLPFKVTQDTLDPRPDSEVLVKAVLELHKDRLKPLHILDLGTGTGCLLLSLLHEYPNAIGIGVDISEAACLIAQANAKNLGLQNRAHFVIGNWGDALQENFDIIISNPPYISINESLPVEVKSYDPALALFGGEDGFDAYRILSQNLQNLASPQTKMLLEIGKGQYEKISQIFNDYKILNVINDLQGIKRGIVFCMHAMSVD